MYKSGISASDIANIVGHDRDTLLRIFKEEGIEIRRGKKPRLFSVADEIEIAKMYEAGMTGHQIAKEKDCGSSAIYNALKRQGIDFREGAMGKAEDNVAWRGGRTTNAEGYIYRYIPDGHPLVAMRAMGRYAREHRIVMAESLGRPLKKGEQVHHINGDKADNRIENLQLRQG